LRGKKRGKGDQRGAASKKKKLILTGRGEGEKKKTAAGESLASLPVIGKKRGKKLEIKRRKGRGKKLFSPTKGEGPEGWGNKIFGVSDEGEKNSTSLGELSSCKVREKRKRMNVVGSG